MTEGPASPGRPLRPLRPPVRVRPRLTKTNSSHEPRTVRTTLTVDQHKFEKRENNFRGAPVGSLCIAIGFSQLARILFVNKSGSDWYINDFGSNLLFSHTLPTPLLR